MGTITILDIIKLNRLLLTIWKQELSCTEDIYLLIVLHKAYMDVVEEVSNYSDDKLLYKDLYDKVLNKFEEMV
ncbi:hypothetical protein VP14_068 [Vibrio phage VPMCC14]|nr:hypothetical protein VP14_068 [Vibrio phage VPMCC14]